MSQKKVTFPPILSSIHFKYTIIPSILLSIITLFSLNSNAWIVSDVDHFYFEMFAVVLSAIIAFYCIARAYSLNERFSLFIGIGFVTISIIDLLHATLSLRSAGNNVFLDYFIPQTWFAGRTFLGIMLAVAVINYTKKGGISSLYSSTPSITQIPKDSGDKRENAAKAMLMKVLSSSFGYWPQQPTNIDNKSAKKDSNELHRSLLFSLILLAVLAIWVVDISFITVFPGIRIPYLINRPYEIPALALFSLSLFYFYKRRLYKSEDVFYRGLLGALIIDIFIQIIMSFSSSNFHTAHNVAHILKDSAYFIIVISLAMSSIQHNKIARERAEIIRSQYLRLKEADKMKDEFINVAAHELRTPIQPILGLSELLRSRLLNNNINNNSINASQLEMLETIIRNAKRLNRMTENILDVTKIESHSFKLSKETVNMQREIQNIITESRSYLSNNNQQLEIIFEPCATEPILVKADRSKIFEVLSNLLRNAIKFTETGTITVSLKKQEDDYGNRYAVVSIRDTGTGIDSDIMPRLFSKFASNNICGGTGLGLFISKNIIEGHGGKIWASNNVDENGKIKGATFTFTLPFTKGNNSQEQQQEQRPLPSRCFPSMSVSPLYLNSATLLASGRESTDSGSYNAIKGNNDNSNSNWRLQ